MWRTFWLLALLAFVSGQNDNGVPRYGETDIQSSYGGSPSPDLEDKSCVSHFGEGICAPYYLCSNGTINKNGMGIIDIRIGASCHDTFEECCPLINEIDKEPKKTFIVPPIVPENIHSKCGIRNHEGVGIQIVGDLAGESQFGEWSWMIAVLEDKVQHEGHSIQFYMCGGSLIHHSVVLTAAHCVDEKNVHKMVVRAGEWDTQTKNEVLHHADRYVKEIVIHPNFMRGTLYNDVALLITKEPFTLAPHINTICLPHQDANYDFSDCFVTGWGRDEFGKEGKYQTILKKIELPIVPFEECQGKLRKTRLSEHFQLHSSFVCAGGWPGKDACLGDGGSPLVCPLHEHLGHYVQAGIVSWGIGCGEKYVPGVYVAVSCFRHWIDSQMAICDFDSQSYII